MLVIIHIKHILHIYNTTCKTRDNMRCSIKHYPALKHVKTLFLKIYDVQGKIRKAWDIIHYCSINKSRLINLYQQLVLTMHTLQVQFVQDHCLISVLNALTLLADFIC